MLSTRVGRIFFFNKPGDLQFLDAELDGVIVAFHKDVDLILLSLVHPAQDHTFAQAFYMDLCATGQSKLLQVSGDRNDARADPVSPCANRGGGIRLTFLCIVGGDLYDPGDLTRPFLFIPVFRSAEPDLEQLGNIILQGDAASVPETGDSNFVYEAISAVEGTVI